MKSERYSPEYGLLLQAVRLDDIAAAAREAEMIISAGPVGWDELLKRAKAHRIRPQVEALLGRISASMVPDNIKMSLAESNRENLLRQLRNFSEFRKVNDVLAESNISAVPFKGFWLAHDMYGNLGDRESSDIDLFIDLKDLDAIKRTMVMRGFKLQNTLAKLTEEYILGELAEYNFSKFSGETVTLHFEFHWRMGLKAYRMDISMEDLRSQLMKGIIGGNEFTVFTPAANLLLAVMHHGGKDRFMQLRNILDVAQIIRKHPDLDWEWLLMQARRFHVETLVFLGVRLAAGITGVHVPDGICRYTNTRRIKRLAGSRLHMMSGPVDSWFTYEDDLRGWLFKIRSRDGLKTKVQLSWYTLRKIIVPHLVPLKWRHLFFNKSIIAESAAGDEA